MHEGVETFIGLFMALVGEVEGDHRGFELGMAQVARDEPGIDTGFEQMGGVRMPEGMDGYTGFGDAGSLFGFTEGALDAGPTHWIGSRRTLAVIAPGGGKEPGRGTMGFPVRAKQREGIGGQGDVPVFCALAAGDMNLEALAVDGRDLQEEGFMAPESQAIDGGEVRLVVEGRGRLQEPPDLLYTEHGGETVCSLRTQEREGVPVALEDVLGEEADATIADAHGSGGKAIDVFAVQEVMLQFLFRDAVGGFVVELSQEADFPDIGFLGPFALAAELESRNHLLTQGGHEISPFVRRVIRLRRKTS